jgi:hypothetical protein
MNWALSNPPQGEECQRRAGKQGRTLRGTAKGTANRGQGDWRLTQGGDANTICTRVELKSKF